MSGDHGRRSRDVEINTAALGRVRLKWEEIQTERDGDWQLAENSTVFQSDNFSHPHDQVARDGGEVDSACEAWLKGTLTSVFGITTEGVKAVSLSARVDEEFASVLADFRTEVEKKWASHNMSDRAFSFNAFDNRTSFVELEDGGGASNVQHMEQWLQKHRVATDFLHDCATNFIVSLQIKESRVPCWQLPKGSNIRAGMMRVGFALDEVCHYNIQLLEKIKLQSEGEDCRAPCEALTRLATNHDSVTFEVFRSMYKDETGTA